MFGLVRKIEAKGESRSPKSIYKESKCGNTTKGRGREMSKMIQ